MNKLLSVENLLSAFPLSLSEDSEKAALASVTASELIKLYEENDILALYTRIDELEEPLLDILAYDFKIDWWDKNYTLKEKRETFKNSWNVHRILGTPTAVELALSSIYERTTILEWFEYGGKPYYFKLHIESEDLMTDYEKIKTVLDNIRFYKNKRSILEKAEIDIKQSVNAYVGMAIREGITEHIKCNTPELPDETFVLDGKGRVVADGSGAWIAL